MTAAHRTFGRVVLGLFCWVLLYATAQAGPWPREKGRGFASVTSLAKQAEMPTDPLSYTSIYLEYGLRDTLTIGLDLGADDLGEYKAIAFALRPVRAFGKQTPVAIELGIGAVNDQMVLRPGLLIGRGFKILKSPGWFSVETRATILADTGQTGYGSDVTLGISPSARTKLILQLQTGGSMADPDYARFAPSFVYTTKSGRHLEIGVTAGLKHAESFGLKVGVWTEF